MSVRRLSKLFFWTSELLQYIPNRSDTSGLLTKLLSWFAQLSVVEFRWILFGCAVSGESGSDHHQKKNKQTKKRSKWKKLSRLWPLKAINLISTSIRAVFFFCSDNCKLQTPAISQDLDAPWELFRKLAPKGFPTRPLVRLRGKICVSLRTYLNPFRQTVAHYAWACAPKIRLMFTRMSASKA